MLEAAYEYDRMALRIKGAAAENLRSYLAGRRFQFVLHMMLMAQELKNYLHHNLIFIMLNQYMSIYLAGVRIFQRLNQLMICQKMLKPTSSF